MKKIVGIVAAASLVAGLAFADGPTANLAITDFTGNAQVQWGVDLDSGTTGFKNSEYMKFVINLFDAGTKATSGDDVWGELEMKAGNTGWWAHRIHQTDANVDFNADAVNGGVASTISFDITAAKLHFGDFYVGIQNGDTTTGTYKFDGAIRSADNDNAKWLSDVGPAIEYVDKDGKTQYVQYSQGIVAGYGNNNFGIDVDFRSNPFDNYNKDANKVEFNQYTSDYAIALEAKLKDSNEWVEGLFVDLGGSADLSQKHYVKGKKVAEVKPEYGYIYTDADENPATEPVVSWGVTNKPTPEYGQDNEAIGYDKYAVDGFVGTGHSIGYSFNAGYKLKIDDKNWLKPAVGLTGTYATVSTNEYDVGTKKVSASTSENHNNLVAGVILGWGDTADANAGLYYFDNDDTCKKVTPGVSVVAKIPLAVKTATTIDGKATSETESGAVQALIVPSFYTNGELVEGLKAAVYSEMALLRSEGKEDGTDNKVITKGAADKNDTFALALAGAVAYDIKADEITVTPQAGFRFVNTAYADNEIAGMAPNKKFFDGLGIQDTVTEGERAKILNEDGKAYLLKDGYFNLKAGVNVNGLIPNTDIFAVYQSANLLNATNYGDIKASNDPEKTAKFYNVKLGTFNVGCKISL